MTDLIKALADGAALLSRLGEMVERVEAYHAEMDTLKARIDELEGKLVDMDTMDTDHADLIERLDERVDRIKDRVVTLENDSGRWLETGDDLDSQIETVVERVLDRVLEDTLDSALSGREITVTL